MNSTFLGSVTNLLLLIRHLVELSTQWRVGSPQEEVAGAAEMGMPSRAILATSAAAGEPPRTWASGPLRPFCDHLWPGYARFLPYCD